MAEAFDLLKPVSNLQEAEYDESVSKGIKQFGLIEPKFGKPYAYKFVREEEIAMLPYG